VSGGLPKGSWTRGYLEHLRSQVDWAKVEAEVGAGGPEEGGGGGGDPEFRVAVHVRRGDVTPCNKWGRRYLPNAHYLRVLDERVPRDRPARVYVFSERKSSESWEPFRARNYTMMLDASVRTTWAHLMTADLVVLGWSSFGLLPATFNGRGRVLYTPFNLGPVRGWEVLNRTYLDLVKLDRARLRCRGQ
jgi:hypothetical protein